MSYILLSMIPFIIAIVLIIWREEPILPLLLSIFVALWILYRFNPVSAFLKLVGFAIANSLGETDNILLIIMIAEVLILFYLFREGGHIKALIGIKRYKKLSRYIIEYIMIGLSFLLSFEERLSTLMSGVFLKAFVNEKGITKERFSFLINNLGPSFYTLIPLTLFTPIVTRIIGGSLSSLGIDYPSLKVFLHSIPFQFYNIFILIIIASSSILKKDIIPIANPIKKDSSLNSTKANLSKEKEDKNAYSLVIAPYKKIGRKPDKINDSLYSAGISFVVTIIALVTTAVFLIAQFYKGKLIELQNFERIFTAAIFGGILYYIIYSLIFKSVSIKMLSTKNNSNAKTLIVILYIILSLALLFIAKKLEIFSKLTEIIFSSGKIDLSWYPLIFFFISALSSFLTGSRITVLYILIPMAFKLISINLPDPLIINYFHYAVLGAIISGSSFGIINSPLSLIFIISTASSELSIKTHFVSQIYYSAIALVFSALFGYLLSFFNISPYLSITMGLIFISSFFTFGKRFLAGN